MDEKRRPTDDEFTADGDQMVHHPSGTRVRFGEDGTIGVPINWDDDGSDDYSQAQIVEKAVEIRRRRSHS
jgi:hypothetical protein